MEEMYIDLPLVISTIGGKRVTLSYIKRCKRDLEIKRFHQYVSQDKKSGGLSIMYKSDDGECLSEDMIIKELNYQNKLKWKNKNLRKKLMN